MSQASLRRRRWYQFSLRTLLVVLMLAAGGAGAVHILLEPYRRQQEAIALIMKCFGSYTTEEPARWVRWLDKSIQDVVVVDLADCDQPDEYLPHVLRLPKLRTLVVGGHQFTDDHLRALRSALGLRGLVLDSTKVTPEGLDGLKEALPDLVVWKSERRACVELEKVGVTAQYDSLANARASPPLSAEALERLRIDVGDQYFAAPADSVSALRECMASDADLMWLANLQALRGIYLAGTSTTGAFLADITASAPLESLYLDETKTTDASVIQDIPRVSGRLLRSSL